MSMVSLRSGEHRASQYGSDKNRNRYPQITQIRLDYTEENSSGWCCSSGTA